MKQQCAKKKHHNSEVHTDAQSTAQAQDSAGAETESKRLGFEAWGLWPVHLQTIPKTNTPSGCEDPHCPQPAYRHEYHANSRDLTRSHHYLAQAPEWNFGTLSPKANFGMPLHSNYHSSASSLHQSQDEVDTMRTTALTYSQQHACAHHAQLARITKNNRRGRTTHTHTRNPHTKHAQPPPPQEAGHTYTTRAQLTDAQTTTRKARTQTQPPIRTCCLFAPSLLPPGVVAKSLRREFPSSCRTFVSGNRSTPRCCPRPK